MSADDIQKAKMRATFMQSKYFDKSKTSLAGNSLEKFVNGKPKTSSIENLQERTNNQKTHTVTQSAEIRLSPSIQAVVNCEKTSLSSTSGTQTLASLSQNGDSTPMSDPLQLKQEEDTTVICLTSETSDALLETSKPSMVPQEPLWKKSKRDQVQWQTPPEMWMNDAWSIGAGEKSKEVEVQTARIRREKETIYSSIHDIPSNPKEPWDVEMDFDDTLTPEIPTEQPPEADGSEAASPCTGDANVEQVPAVASAPVANGLEPDLELLAVLLKNPELVFALTSGQGNGFSSAETVALLDMLKRSNINLPGALSGLGEKLVEKPGMTSLPSPTPPAEREMRWRMESAPSAVPNLSHQPVMPGPRFPPAVPTQTISLAQHRIPSTYPAALGMPEKPPPPMTLNQSSTVVTTLQNAAAAPVQKPYHSVAPQAQSSTTPSQHFNALESNMHPSTNLPHLARIPQQTAQPDVKNFGRLQQPQQAPPPPVSMVPSPPPAAAAQPTTRFSPWSGGNAAAGGSGGQQHRAYPDSPTPATEHFPPNLSSYKAFPGSRMPLSGIDRNEHLGSGAPEFETWSPEGSPARCRELNYERHPDHRSYSSGASGSRRDSGRNYRQSEWPPRHYRSGNSSSSSGRSRSSDRRWRERERERDHRRR